MTKINKDFLRGLVLVPEDIGGQLAFKKTVTLDFRIVAYHGRNGWSIADKVKLKNPNFEGSEIPLFAAVRGFYTDELFLADDDLILPTSLYVKMHESDRTWRKDSKYPFTEDLRDYLNWKFLSEIERKEEDKKRLAIHAMDMRSHGIDVSNVGLMLFQNMNVSQTSRQQGLEIVPRHLHFDDFQDKWQGKIHIRLARELYGGNFGVRGSDNRLYDGIIIDNHFRPANSSNPMNGLERFNNYQHHYRGFYGHEEVQDKLNAVWRYPEHPLNTLYAKLNRDEVGRPGGLEMWDPVQDVVKVEKILGNVSFLSEFGYICSMNKYDLIFGELEDQLKTILL